MSYSLGKLSRLPFLMRAGCWFRRIVEEDVHKRICKLECPKFKCYVWSCVLPTSYDVVQLHVFISISPLLLLAAISDRKVVLPTYSEEPQEGHWVKRRETSLQLSSLLLALILDLLIHRQIPLCSSPVANPSLDVVEHLTRICHHPIFARVEHDRIGEHVQDLPL